MTRATGNLPKRPRDRSYRDERATKICPVWILTSTSVTRIRPLEFAGQTVDMIGRNQLLTRTLGTAPAPETNEARDPGHHGTMSS